MPNHSHTKRLITTYTRRLQLLEEKQAFFGMHTDPAIIMEIEEIQLRLGTLQSEYEQPAGNSVILRSLTMEIEQPPACRGLIVLVGTGREDKDPMSQSAGAAIRYHLESSTENGLAHCWLIPSGLEPAATPDPPRQRERAAIDVARTLAEVCTTHGVVARIWPIAEAFSVQETYELIQWLFIHEVLPAGLSEQDVICDFTGGTKLMSAGMILACGDRWPMQYMVRDATNGSSPLFVRYAPTNSLQ